MRVNPRTRNVVRTVGDESFQGSKTSGRTCRLESDIRNSVLYFAAQIKRHSLHGLLSRFELSAKVQSITKPGPWFAPANPRASVIFIQSSFNQSAPRFYYQSLGRIFLITFITKKHLRKRKFKEMCVEHVYRARVISNFYFKFLSISSVYDAQT